MRRLWHVGFRTPIGKCWSARPTGAWFDVLSDQLLLADAEVKQREEWLRNLQQRELVRQRQMLAEEARRENPTGAEAKEHLPGMLMKLGERHGPSNNRSSLPEPCRPRIRPNVARLCATASCTADQRPACRARKDLVKHRVAAANQLRAHLRNVFPGAVGLFKDIDSEISLAFLSRFDTQDRADWLTPKRLADWLTKQGYSGKVDPTVLHQRLLDAARSATGTHATDQAHITTSYVALLRTLLEQIKTLEKQIDRQLDAHADAHIFTSLPRSGRVRAARLLAEIGDCRARFPTPESLTCLAGAAPSTRQSGKLRAVGFRWSCDKQLRDAVVDFAADTRPPTPGPLTSTTAPEPAATTTPTPPASLPEPGSTSSGTAGKTEPPTTPTNTAHSNASSQPKPRQVDIGLLTARPAGCRGCGSHQWAARPGPGRR